MPLGGESCADIWHKLRVRVCVHAGVCVSVVWKGTVQNMMDNSMSLYMYMYM